MKGPDALWSRSGLATAIGDAWQSGFSVQRGSEKGPWLAQSVAAMRSWNTL